jgi:hypothetical protein
MTFLADSAVAASLCEASPKWFLFAEPTGASHGEAGTVNACAAAEWGTCGVAASEIFSR